MGFFDALTADAFPRDSQGRSVLAPYGRRGKAFILPTERAPQLARIQRRFFVSFLIALVGAAIMVGPRGILAVGVLWILGFVVGISYFTGGLEESAERPTMPRAQAVDRAMRAMGRRTMWALCLAGAASAAVGVWLLLRGEHGLAIWFIAVYSTVVSVLYAWKLYQMRTTRPAT
jgi:hypothetical protein